MTSENTTPEDPQTAANPTPGQPRDMPLAARRLLMIGGLALPVGLLAGPFLLPAQLLAVAGIVVLAVAFSYRAGEHWFSRWPLAVAIAGGLWLAATAAYYASIMVAADASAPLPGFAQIFYNAGVACFAVMAIATATGVACRTLAKRRLRSQKQFGGPGRV